MNSRNPYELQTKSEVLRFPEIFVHRDNRDVVKFSENNRKVSYDFNGEYENISDLRRQRLS